MYRPSPVVIVLPVFEIGNVSSPQQQFLVLDNEQRSTDTSGVGVDANLAVAYVTDHRHLHTHTHTQSTGVVTPVPVLEWKEQLWLSD